MRTVDLFCGCGGMSLGFQYAGCNIVAAFENWPSAVQCYQANFKHPIYRQDLSCVAEVSEIIKGFSPDLIIGGPPCQDFSNAGKRTEGERAELTYSFAQIVTNVKPKYFVMENVVRAIESSVYQKTKSLFISAGYGLSEIILDASFCGVPQKRRRFFCIGAINTPNGFLDKLVYPQQSILPMSVREYYRIQGYDLPFEYYYRHPRSYKRRGIFEVDIPAPTIRGVNRPKPPEYKKHENDPVDPTNIRAMTTRERARIQTFPDSFVLPQNTANAEQMIGNAVPVQLAKFVATALISFHSGKAPNPGTPFIDWLKQSKNFTSRAAGDIVSRINRANKILPIDGRPAEAYIPLLEANPVFSRIKPTVQSQIKRAIRLYCEYLALSKKDKTNC